MKYSLYEINQRGPGGPIYTIHAEGYRCHVGKHLRTVEASDIDGALNQLIATQSEAREFKECGCIHAALAKARP